MDLPPLEHVLRLLPLPFGCLTLGTGSGAVGAAILGLLCLYGLVKSIFLALLFGLQTDDKNMEKFFLAVFGVNGVLLTLSCPLVYFTVTYKSTLGAMAATNLILSLCVINLLQLMCLPLFCHLFELCIITRLSKITVVLYYTVFTPYIMACMYTAICYWNYGQVLRAADEKKMSKQREEAELTRRCMMQRKQLEERYENEQRILQKQRMLESKLQNLAEEDMDLV